MLCMPVSAASSAEGRYKRVSCVVARAEKQKAEPTRRLAAADVAGRARLADFHRLAADAADAKRLGLAHVAKAVALGQRAVDVHKAVLRATKERSAGVRVS